MGYSVSCPVKSAKAKKQMLEFLAENFRAWTDIPNVKEVDETANPDFDVSRYVLTGAEMSYDHGASKIGFDYGCLNEPLNHYVFSVLRWMALKVGRVRRFKEIGGGRISVPYIVYDGFQAWPVLLDSVWDGKVEEKQKWMVVNCNGYKPIRRLWLYRPEGAPDLTPKQLEFFAKEDENFKKQEVVIHEELLRLSDLWSKFIQSPVV